MSTEVPTELPQFNASTLQNLTQQIQQNIAASKSKSSKPARNAAAKGRTKGAESSEKTKIIKQSEKQRTSGRQSTEQANVVKSVGTRQEQESSRTQPSQGSKRLRNGDIKPSKIGSADVRKDRKTDVRGRISKGSEADGLREEILALGGTIEDYEALKNLNSDEEVSGPKEKHVEGVLLKDIQGFVKGLGIDRVREAFDAESEEEDDAEDGQDIDKAQKKETIDASAAGKGVIQPLSEWHAADLPSLPIASDNQKAASFEVVERLHDHAKALLQRENQAFAATQRGASSSHQFYTTIMTTGTLSDKISALTLSVQESPLHNMKALEQLLALAKKNSRSQAVDVLGALKDLFGPGNLLPSDRKLLAFTNQVQLHAAVMSGGSSWKEGQPPPKPLTEAHLIFWAFEDWLKTAFFQILQILETWSNDEVVFARGRAVDYVFTLLKDKPEQEQNLLRLLVNKLGDRDKKVASKTSYRIIQLMTAHPALKPTIITAMESDLIFRPNQSLHAQYYATITLNQTVLSNGEVEVAKKVIAIYFALFLKMLSKPKETKETKDEVNPPAAAIQQVRLNRKGEVQGGGVSVPGKAARKKEEALEKAKLDDVQLKEKMISGLLTGVNRAIPYVSTDDESFDQHLDTLFRVTHSSNFNTSIQALMLIQQIQGQSQVTADRFYRTLYESLLDPRLLTSSKQVLYLNLLYRSLRADLNVDRIKAFAKRITQILSLHQAPFACAAIYLIRELEASFPSLSSFISEAEPDYSEDEEDFHDVPDEDDLNDASKTTTSPKPASKARLQRLYDARKRAPDHANAASSSLWELLPLTKHYHPSVSLFASKILSHAPAAELPPKPDLSLNTLIHFLDRFVNKNPKQGLRGKSVMQPLAHADSAKGAVLVGKTGKETARGNQHEGDVPADEVVFQRYFAATRGKAEKKREKKRRKTEEEEGEIEDLGGDEEGGSEEEDEDEIWDALVKSVPEIEGDDEDDVEIDFSDDDMEDLEDTDDVSEGGVEIVEDGKVDDADDGFPDFGSEDEDHLVGSDDEIGLADALGKTNDRKGDKKQRRKRLRSLPTFASVEEYEKLLGGSDAEEDI